MTAGPFLHLPLFDGPLDLLLHLCRRHELSVAELPIAEVTEQFLAYLEVMDDLQIELAGEFVEMAALLCLLKSREILPRVEIPGLQDDGDEPGLDPRAELVRRLLEYRSFVEAADSLEARPRLDHDFFVRRQPPMEAAGLKQADAPLQVDLTELLGALAALLTDRSRPEPVHAIGEPALSLPERMRAVLAVMAEAETERVELRQLFDGALTRASVVVTFLAILQLAYLGHVRLAQRKHLVSITVQRRWSGSPPSVTEPADAR